MIITLQFNDAEEKILRGLFESYKSGEIQPFRIEIDNPLFIDIQRLAIRGLVETVAEDSLDNRAVYLTRSGAWILKVEDEIRE